MRHGVQHHHTKPPPPPIVKPEEEEEVAYQAALAVAMQTSIEEEQPKAEEEEADYQARLAVALALFAIGNGMVSPLPPRLTPPTPKAETPGSNSDSGIRWRRIDRRRSVATDVNLPGPDFTVPQAAAFFRTLGLGSDDMVVLLGAHTVGVAHCSMIKKSRLYSYGGKAGATDPSMDPELADTYKTYVCPNSSDNNIVFLDDRSSASKLDNSFYKMLQRRRGALMVDQNLYSDGSTRWMVDGLANTDHFRWLFSQALAKLGEVNVLTGTQGEVRSICTKFNR
ncbi:peroxidase 57-like [Triticum urartu]|uniref:peroxidase 57-like n=1 Tax=Triticum urartu TaxID=4572 RepID=UPI002044B66F|nr:peroxidase 57-like [Triticum urartu]